MIPFPAPFLPTPGPYAGTTLNPGPSLVSILLAGVGALFLGLTLALSIATATWFLDKWWRNLMSWLEGRCT
jgi:hypothetical protein